MKNIVLALIGVAAIATAQAQNSTTAVQPNDPFLTVNGKTAYTVSQFRQRLGNVIRATGVKYSPQLEHRIARDLVRLEVLSDYAKAQKYDQAPQFKAQLTQALNNVATQSLANESVIQYLKQHPVTDAELNNVYQNLVVKNLQSQKEYEIDHILVAKESEAKKLISDLRRRRISFTKAAEKSIDPSAKTNKGFISWKLSNDFIPEIRTVLATLKKGQLYTKPIHSQFGYHIVKLVAVRPATIPPLAQVKGQLTDLIQEQRINQLVDSLVRQYKVQLPIYNKLEQGKQAK